MISQRYPLDAAVVWDELATGWYAAVKTTDRRNGVAWMVSGRLEPVDESARIAPDGVWSWSIGEPADLKLVSIGGDLETMYVLKQADDGTVAMSVRGPLYDSRSGYYGDPARGRVVAVTTDRSVGPHAMIPGKRLVI